MCTAAFSCAYGLVDGVPADLVLVGDLLHGEGSALIEFADPCALLLGELGGSAALVASGPGRLQSRVGAFPDQVALELRHRGEHVEDQDPAGRGGVHVLRKAFEPHSPGLQQVHQVDEVLHAPAQTVELPHDERVPVADHIEQAVQFGPVRLRARRVIGEQPFTAGLVERVGLQPLVLLQGAHPGIADDHAGSFPTTVRRACRCARG